MTTPMSRAGQAVCLIVLLLLAGVPFLGEDYLIDLTTEILVFVLFALSLNVLIGYSGNVSFGRC